MKPVVLAPQAQDDLERLRQWMLERAPAVAGRLGRAIDDALMSLQEHPLRGRPTVRPDLRELVVRFGAGAYLIRYRVEETRVVVARVMHHREARD